MEHSYLLIVTKHPVSLFCSVAHWGFIIRACYSVVVCAEGINYNFCIQDLHVLWLVTFYNNKKYEGIIVVPMKVIVIPSILSVL
jgi:hypothetical protein